MAVSSSQGRQPSLHPALSPRQGFALLEEAESVRNLLRDSVEAIRRLRFVSLHGDGVFTLGSIGVEKAMKVMLGCNEVEVAGSCPVTFIHRSSPEDLVAGPGMAFLPCH